MSSKGQDSSTYLNTVSPKKWVVGIDLTGKRQSSDFEVLGQFDTLEEAKKEHETAMRLWATDVVLLLEPEDGGQ